MEESEEGEVSGAGDSKLVIFSNDVFDRESGVRHLGTLPRRPTGRK